MTWATVSSWSCFCWLHRASPSLAAKNTINLISVLVIQWCPCVELSLVFAMTSAFSWQNYVSLCPASFCTLRPTLPVNPGISLHFSPLWWKGHLFLVSALERSYGSQSCLTQWNYEPWHVGPPKTARSWWTVLTTCGPLQEVMANHFSILPLRTPWTVWKGKKIWHWRMNSPG